MIEQTISLTLNGKAKDLPSQSTVASMLESLGVDRRTVAVAHNGDVVPRDTYERISLSDGDRVEIVRMVGGG